MDHALNNKILNIRTWVDKRRKKGEVVTDEMIYGQIQKVYPTLNSEEKRMIFTKSHPQH